MGMQIQGQEELMQEGLQANINIRQEGQLLSSSQRRMHKNKFSQYDEEPSQPQFQEQQEISNLQKKTKQTDSNSDNDSELKQHEKVLISATNTQQNQLYEDSTKSNSGNREEINQKENKKKQQTYQAQEEETPVVKKQP